MKKGWVEWSWEHWGEKKPTHRQVIYLFSAPKELSLHFVHPCNILYYFISSLSPHSFVSLHKVLETGIINNSFSSRKQEQHIRGHTMYCATLVTVNKYGSGEASEILLHTR